ncbi:cytochrome b/b6 domain-containing protein [Sulfurimonas sp. HSL1-6]|uniref:cytochrome b/b6 domain-containing protein n=1 Tax=Thiomicrolovo immobilis TaxID=3131935 RepID=UPI0031F78558
MKDYSLQLRVWHWANAVVVLGLLGTFFLRKTFLSWHTNSQILLEKLASFGITVTPEQAAALAKAVRAPMWEWHIILGYVFAVLVLWRLVMIFKEGFGYAPENSHMAWVYRGYKVIYAVMAFMAVSGLLITFYKDIGLAKDVAGSVKELHELVAWAIVAFVVLHIAGVFVADNRDQKGITSKMISG